MDAMADDATKECHDEKADDGAEEEENAADSKEEEVDPFVVVSEFDFVGYTEREGVEAVPEGALRHVDASLDTGVRVGMVVEIPLPQANGSAKASAAEESNSPGTRYILLKYM